MNGTQAIMVMDEADRYDYILRGLCSLSHRAVNQTKHEIEICFLKLRSPFKANITLTVYCYILFLNCNVLGLSFAFPEFV